MDEQTEDRYDAHANEAKVQAYWQANLTFEVNENSEKPKYYALSMFPYPSGQLHMGHVRTYTLGDVISRFQRLQGKNVLHPMGWDAFGLPAENAAIKNQVAPSDWTHQNIAYMKRQMGSLGFSFDWSREFATCDPDYYRWEQWLFTLMFKKGLVYRKSAWVNWDPAEQTVLANEQVIDGKGWRSGEPVERMELEQWFIRITAYAEELLEALDDMPGWPEKIKIMQRNWIGRSYGVELTFPRPGDEGLSVYTTRPDTLMGVTYIAVAPQHALATEAAKDNAELAAFITEVSQVKVAEADMAKMEKRGMPTGLTARHPLTDVEIPIWVGNFVLMEYGSGAVMAVPGHDQRDWEFARKYSLPIRQVIEPAAASNGECNLEMAAFTEKGVCVNSGEFDGLAFDEAFDAFAAALGAQGLGEKVTNYRLRDWGVSRQRYWGCPIPIIHCKDCGATALPEEDLPVVLPTDVQFEGVTSPLSKIPEWYNTTCPTCGGAATRETDTFDTFMESSWYAPRFASSNHDGGILDERAKYWGAVDHYVGGEEHAILHLLYARFFWRVLRDEGLVEGDEPFDNLLALGMVLKDGTKMSKSAGDAGDPQHLLDQHGADAVRMAMMFAAPPEHSFEWSEQGVESAARWLRTRLWNSVSSHLRGGAVETLDVASLNEAQRALRRRTHETIVKATDDYGRRLTFNTVVSSVMALMNDVSRFEDDSAQGRAVLGEALRAAVLILSPITPHISHTLWPQLTGEALEDAIWLTHDVSALVKDSVEVAIQVNGKLRGRVEVATDSGEETVASVAKANENVAKFLEGKEVRKVIHVPNKLMNFVVSG